MQGACPSSPPKRAAIVAAARDAFLHHGYGATTMSAIAAKVGGSKTTLWAYFPSKPALFAAVVDDLVEEFGQALEVPLEPELPLGDALWRYGRGMMGIVTSPAIMELQRLVTGEVARFPEVGRLFYERGPKRGKEKLATYLAAAIDDGRVRPGDPLIAARQFAALCQCHTHQHGLWGLDDPCDNGTIDRDIARAIDSWTRAWAIPPAAASASPTLRPSSGDGGSADPAVPPARSPG